MSRLCVLVFGNWGTKNVTACFVRHIETSIYPFDRAINLSVLGE